LAGRRRGHRDATRPPRRGDRFAATGQPGLLRPDQPTDTRPVPVLADPRTAASATADGRLELGVDGLPVAARVVGVLKRFATLGPGAAGYVVADDATLAAALDAQLPGQGRADEPWISTDHPARLRAGLGTGPLSQLGVSFRAAIERRLRSAPIARGVLGALFAATGVAAVLAVLGLLVAIVGRTRDQTVERDLAVLGVGPRAIRRELSSPGGRSARWTASRRRRSVAA
jgi:hypothetical protein